MNSDMGSISWKTFREGFLSPNKPSGTETVVRITPFYLDVCAPMRCATERPGRKAELTGVPVYVLNSLVIRSKMASGRLIA